jgi:cytochrome c-type biogenesis protein CcmF
MLPEIGHAALIIAAVFALLAGFVALLLQFSLLESDDPNQFSFPILKLSNRLVIGQWLFISLSLVLLGVCFLLNDFSVAYVAQHSNILLPTQYKVSAIWGGHEGSLLLWVWILCLWCSFLVFRSKALPTRVVITLNGVLGFITLGFLLFIIFTSNPFDRLLPNFPMDGQDLNPLLQDFGLIVHPPMLYMGYVGFAIPFAFAITGLIEGEFDRRWAAWARPWAKSAWAFLGLGIALGSWWAYYELGWGGWWFWDPVENASFMPWLAGLALIHSLLACEKRDGFKIWSVLIAIITFSLSLLGTFLVRSGVLTSVHAFASDPSRGLFILVFLGLVVGGSLALFSSRASSLQSESRFTLFSKEFFLILNNIFVLVACATVLLGTLFPIISDVLNLGKVSVGPPYFNSLFFPLTLLLLLVMAVVPELKWGSTPLDKSYKKLAASLALSVLLVAIAIFLLAEAWDWKVFSVLSLTLWVTVFLYLDLFIAGLLHPVKWWGCLSSSQKNMHLAHFGFLVSLFGIVMTSAYSEERDVSLAANESVEVSSYQMKFMGVDQVQGPNYVSTKGHIIVTGSSGKPFDLYPEKRHYYMQVKPMTEAAIDPQFHRDIYVALGEDLGAERWSLRVYHKPFIRLIWLGAIIMGFSCFYYLFSRRKS